MSDPAGGGGLQIPLRFVHNWPATHGGVGKRIADAEAVPGAVRHELILEKAVLGKLIGVGGSVVNSLQTQTGCGIFVVDKEAPPGLAETQRLVVLVGTLAQCELGTIAVFSALEGGTRPASHAPPSHAPAMAVAPTTCGSCTRLVANWPPPHGGNGKRIAEAEAVPGVVRHEILLDKNCLGKLIGVGGAMLKELQTRTGTQIHVCDKEPPPGYAESQRLIVIIGAEYLIGRAAAEIFAVVESVAYKQGAVRGGAPPAQAAGVVGYGPPPPPAYGAPPPSMPVQLGTAYTPHGTELTRYVSQWPNATTGLQTGVARRLAEAESAPGALRHELLVDKNLLGKLIGPGGSKLKEIMTHTACGVFVCDKEAPPGYAEAQRLVVLVGLEPAVRAASLRVFETVGTGMGGSAHGGNGAGGAVGGAVAANRDAPPQVGGGFVLPHFLTHLEGWPSTSPDTERIAAALGPGRVRHDVVVPRTMLGRIIGPGGAQKRELRAKTNADIYVIDHEPPPGSGANERMVVLCGTPLQV